MSIIYFCYTREDRERVGDVYNFLTGQGYETFRQVEDESSQQQVETAIEKEIYNSNYILIFLSKFSVRKELFFQRELRIVKEKTKKQRGATTGIILILLDECHIPGLLEGFPIVTLYNGLDTYGCQQLEEALNDDRFTELATNKGLSENNASEESHDGPDFSFIIANEEVKTHYRFVLDQGKPKKIGDGSFGAVFCVMDDKNNLYALKIFYRSNNIIPNKYIQGTDAYRLLYKALDKDRISSSKGFLLLPVDWTQDLISSSDCQKYFDNIGLSFSRCAIVMPLYNCSLKDLLEHGAPENRIVQGIREESRGDIGYQVLQGLNYMEREQAILPIIFHVAKGLQELHAAELYHHDVNPSNVLLRQDGNKLQVAISDLGSLTPRLSKEEKKSEQNSFSPTEPLLPLGTRHYRSPEQIDYFDICEVRVESHDHDATVLLTQDPKFIDTLIEADDYLVFLKDKN